MDKKDKKIPEKLKNIKVKYYIHSDLTKIRALLELKTGKRMSMSELIEYLLKKAAKS